MKQLLEKLIADTMTGKFGTKHRSELITRLQAIYLELTENKLKFNIARQKVKSRQKFQQKEIPDKWKDRV